MSAATQELARSRERVFLWYRGLEPRERQIVLAGAIFVPALIVLAILLQLHSAVTRLDKRIATKRADLSYVQSVLPMLRGAPRSPGPAQSLPGLIDRTARDAGLAGNLKGTDPVGAKELRVRLEAAPFDALVGWLLQLERAQGIVVGNATIERTAEPGKVNATFSLVQP
jgi:general secretion pathway protein M